MKHKYNHVFCERFRWHSFNSVQHAILLSSMVALALLPPRSLILSYPQHARKAQTQATTRILRRIFREGRILHDPQEPLCARSQTCYICYGHPTIIPGVFILFGGIDHIFNPFMDWWPSPLEKFTNVNRPWRFPVELVGVFQAINLHGECLDVP